VRCLLPACDRPLSSPPESFLASDTPYSRLWRHSTTRSTTPRWRAVRHLGRKSLILREL
jgi:hypothetical protein